MNAGAAPVLGAALLVVCIALLYAYLVYGRGEADPVERAENKLGTPREFFIQTIVRFGGVMATIALGTAIGVLIWDLSLSAVGLYGNPVRELAIGFGVAPAVVVVSYLLKYVIERAEQKFGDPRDEPNEPADPHLEFLIPETRSELGWVLGGFGIQASAEEVYFRAALVGAPATLLSVSAWYFIIPSAILFGLVHVTGGRTKILHASVLGVVLGVVFVVVGILAAIVVHVLHNQVSAIREYRDESSTPRSSGVTPES